MPTHLQNPSTLHERLVPRSFEQLRTSTMNYSRSMWSWINVERLETG